MVEFVKIHGLGNDFLIVDGPDTSVSTDQVVRLCRRHRGVGADGVLMVEPTERGAAMVVYNRDGSRPEMCGNGVRCVAAYASQYLGADDELDVDTDAGPRRCRVEQVSQHLWEVTVDMGTATVEQGGQPLEIDGHRFDYVSVDMGNPHAVIFDRPGDEVIDRLGEMANGPDSPFVDGVNLEFVVDGADGYRAVVYERGVGRTRACGTGACAVAAAAWETGRRPDDQQLRVVLPGGALELRQDDDALWMTGPAEELFSGVWRR